MFLLPWVTSYTIGKQTIKPPEKPLARVDNNVHLWIETDALAEMIREDVTKQYIRQIWMNVAVALIPLMLTFTATAYCIITEYNNDINRQISEQHIQTQERIHQLEKQIAILEQQLGQAAEQTSN